MKRTSTLLLALLFTLSAFSQITITASHMPQLNDAIPRAQDTLTNHQPGPSGPNQSWTFLNNTVHNSPTTTVVSVASTPYASDFPGSNLAYTNDNSAYVFFNSTSNSLISTGAAGDLLMNGDNILTVFNPDLLLHNFPKTYGDTQTDFYAFDAQADGSSFNVSRVWLFHEGTVYDTVDGWGTITTPVGTYNCLRQKHVEHSYDSILFTLTPPPFEFWALFGVTRDTSVSYSWLALETKLNVAELSFDTLGNPKNFTWSLIPPSVTIGVDELDNKEITVYPNPASEYVTINVPSPGNNYNLMVYDATGKLVSSHPFNTGQPIPVGHLDNGIYLYDVSIGNKKVSSGKLQIHK